MNQFFIMKAEVVFDQLKKIENIDVYYKNDVPREYHFSNHKRICKVIS